MCLIGSATSDVHPKGIELNAHWMCIDRVHMAQQVSRFEADNGVIHNSKRLQCVRRIHISLPGQCWKAVLRLVPLM